MSLQDQTSTFELRCPKHGKQGTSFIGRLKPPAKCTKCGTVLAEIPRPEGSVRV